MLTYFAVKVAISSRCSIMNTYRTNSIYGYCLIDEKPPRVDLEALYRVLDHSKYFKGCVIIERIDKNDFCGVRRWIVEQASLELVNQSV